MTRLDTVTIRARVDAWRAFVGKLGGVVIDTPSGVDFTAGGIRVEVAGGHGGITGWSLVGDGDSTSIDGIATSWVAPHALAPNQTLTFDHIVLMTDDLGRTTECITAATAAPLKRIRDAGGGRQQGFFRFGEAIVEVVAPVGERPHLWGFVLNVADLDDVCDRLGPELVSLPKPAVQPGRFITTVKSAAGLGTAVALMTPGR